MGVRRWTGAAGAWLGIGTAPAALVLGAAMAARHGGAVPLAGLLVGAALMAGLLWGQGRIGLRPPRGDGRPLTGVLPAYVRRVPRAVLAGVLAASMIGWNGFNVGLGGASLSALAQLPGWAGPVLLEALVLAVSLRSVRFGNRVAVATTLSAVALVGWCLVALPPPTAPVRVDVSAPVTGATWADVAALVGYVAVFAVRAPDFSVGLARRRDLAWCVGLLVVPTLLGVVVGAGLWSRTGSADVVAVLATAGVAGWGNLLVAVGVFAAALTTTYSGGLAVRGLAPRVPPAVATAAVAGLGGLLAVARFDRSLLSWLTLLAAALPALVVPMAVEAAARRRGRASRPVPAWCWVPAAVVAVVATVAGVTGAPLFGLALAVLLTLVRHPYRRR
ncbi:hypothetical protein D7223_14255 [Micromonospora endolithica]|uniref:Cytosine permease n=1 Tax=Micromonospora endolithica TaxID=230091 RepID=A0A3A9ZIL2_9ACTN|nr:hypothetical protein D7223_14255 [Micromonospora endolithica]TWJ21586.1 purine-cytosine permease-like protein [Micromonospora endolithica]